MTEKHIKHVRHHARKHHKSHEQVKKLLKKGLKKDNFLMLFLGTFTIAIVTIVIFMNWANILSFFGEMKKDMNTEVIKIEEGVEIEVPTPKAGSNAEEIGNYNGFLKGVVTTYQVNGQSADQYIRLIRQIDGQGHMVGIEAVDSIAKMNEEKEQVKTDMLVSSIYLTNDLSEGNHLTSLREGGRLLQKSILATFYLGEKTVDISSAIQNDSKLLSQINNTLSVDLFAYLNQSVDRASSLDNYLHLLDVLLDNAQRRSNELQSKISFLDANYEAQEKSIEQTEDAFFDSLKMFNGENAEAELGEFIGVSQEQTEVKAKMSAYQKLKEYYDFFIPRIQNLTKEIKANRDALIAGVKVTEIQNMSLPLIIKQR